MAFQSKYRFYGGNITNEGPYTVKSGETLKQGMICKITSGELEPADAGATLVGFAADDYAAGDKDAYLTPIDQVMADPSDANARTRGDNLDIASGSQGVDTDSNHDFVVVETSLSTEDTLIMIKFANSDLV